MCTNIINLDLNHLSGLEFGGKNVCLFDFENSTILPKSSSEKDAYLVFEGSKQRGVVKKHYENSELGISNLYVIEINGSGKNYLDFALLAVTGQLSGKNPKSIKIYSNDKGYDSYIETMRRMVRADIRRVQPPKPGMKSANSYDEAMRCLSMIYRQKVSELGKNLITRNEAKSILNTYNIFKPAERTNFYRMVSQMNSQLC